MKGDTLDWSPRRINSQSAVAEPVSRNGIISVRDQCHETIMGRPVATPRCSRQGV